MIRIYTNSEGGIVETDSPGSGTWTRITAPTDEELRTESERSGMDLSILTAATDADEISRWEPYDEGTCMIVDIPYMRDDGQFDTLPLAMIITRDRIITVCRISSGIQEHFIETNKNLDLDDRYGFIIRLLFTISKTYQQDLREINLRRKNIEERIDDGVDDKDIVAVHKLENSLVYFVTSLKGCNIVLDLIKRNSEEKLSKQNKELLRNVVIENQQAIEMASIYREVMNSTSGMLSSIMGNRLNSTIRWLTVITFLLSIPMIVSGVYGMNIDLPGQNAGSAFIWLMTGIILICLGTGVWLKKKRFF